MKTAKQLKDHISNLPKNTGIEPQLLQRNYMMECLLKRISVSKYQNNFILKGGLLIAYWIGFETRSTMDLDGTIRNYQTNFNYATDIKWDSIIEVIRVILRIKK